jgi:hypothetical protein
MQLLIRQERGTTINSARYSEMLTDRLKPAIQSKRLGLLSKGIVLLHDNACPHTAAHINIKIIFVHVGMASNSSTILCTNMSI